jgi:hypothetical protein
MVRNMLIEQMFNLQIQHHMQMAILMFNKNPARNANANADDSAF